MKVVFALISMFFFVSCSSQGKKELLGKTDFQKKMNTKFKDASTSPLTKKGLKKFKGLDFFPVDTKYEVKAKLIKTPDALTFNFPTTTNRIAVYKKYGEIHFTIDGTELKLNVYKNELPTIGYENHLFLPFLDKTNGSTSYGGGRFIDVLTTDELSDGSIEIDFNKAYNPYCAYSDRYSCPITPVENSLNIEIKAGVMAYRK
ncbi:hypothetical protein SAMN04489761_1535 [Tenacibaculum sp. MAR_2009_124]|uniref:DUF1684 domain-containing protein n=1 Tax=Tenacibaculum sp. MAR_2009_124 TaxID=1250059 RepID=UPI00089424C6|nr:DUF1684 domain-containing protein [Tenacibaculum sp. MAR_2009_124]SEB71296.1 hypothetical protein SAMN04489761_1535 [Tenacibaculum sp. MAR_2009_124]